MHMSLKNTLFSSCLPTKASQRDPDLLSQHLLAWIVPVNIHASEGYITQSTFFLHLFGFVLPDFSFMFILQENTQTPFIFLEIAFVVRLILMLNAARAKAKGQRFLPEADEYFCAVRINPALPGKLKGGPNHSSIIR